MNSKQSIEEAASIYSLSWANNKMSEPAQFGFITGAKSDAAKEYWFEQFKANIVQSYEALQQTKSQEQVMKTCGVDCGCMNYCKMENNKAHEQKPIDKLELRYYKELFDDLLTILNERRNKYALQGAHEWKIEGYDLAVKVVKSTLLDAPEKPEQKQVPTDEEINDLAEQAYPFEYDASKTPEENNKRMFEVANKRAIFIEGAEAVLKLLD